MSDFQFAIDHMPAVRRVLGDLPMRLFMGVEDAPVQRDLEEATDLVLKLEHVAIAVRIRRNKYWNQAGGDLSVRYFCGGHRTEIHKLRDGFGHFYFFGFSKDNKTELHDWYVLDLIAMRSVGLFDEEKIRVNGWPVWRNADGRTAGLYIPIRDLSVFVIAEAGLTTHQRNILVQPSCEQELNWAWPA